MAHDGQFQHDAVGVLIDTGKWLNRVLGGVSWGDVLVVGNLMFPKQKSVSYCGVGLKPGGFVGDSCEWGVS